MSQEKKHIVGDVVAGDKITGDKVGRDKIVHETHYHYISRPSESPPFLAPNLPPHHIPRESELTTLRTLLLRQKNDVAVTALRGMGGIGKTTLAIALCHDKQIIDSFPDGILWATLGPQADLLSAQVAWGIAFGEDLTILPDAEARASRLRSILYDKHCFLVVDDVWDTNHISSMRVGGPQCITLVTTRERKVAQKVGTAHALDVLKPEQAIALLTQWAGEITEDQKGVAGELAKRLGYLPLALALAGAQTQEGETWENLLAVFRDAQGADIALLDLDEPSIRDESLALTFDLSLKQLGDALPEQFAMLGVFAAGREAPFTEEAAGAVWEVKPIKARKLLGRLVRAAILDKVENNYVLHLVLGDYALSQLDDNTRNAAEDLHRDHYLEILKGSKENWQMTEVAMPQIRTAWRRIVSDNSDSLYAWATAANTFFNLRGLLDDKIAWIDAALKAAQATDQHKRECWCENGLGITFYNLGELDRALIHCRKSLTIQQKIGDRVEEARTLNQIGEIYERRGDLEKALEYFQTSQHTASSQKKAEAIEVFSYNHIGLIHLRRGDLSKALEQFQESIKIINEVNDLNGETITRQLIGHVYNQRGELAEALTQYKLSLDIASSLGDIKQEMSVLNSIGTVYITLGVFDEAMECFQNSLKIAQNIQGRTGEYHALYQIGVIYQNQGDITKALEYIQLSLDIKRRVGDRPSEAWSLHRIGYIYLQQNKLRKALKYLQEGLNIFRDVNSQRGEAHSLNSIGKVYYQQEEFDDALVKFNKSLVIARKIGSRKIEALDLWDIGLAYEKLNHNPKAKKYLAEALNLYEAMKSPTSAKVRGNLERLPKTLT